MYTRWFCLLFSSISLLLFARAASEAHGRNARETVIYIMAGYARSNHKPDYEICANASFGTRASRSESYLNVSLALFSLSSIRSRSRSTTSRKMRLVPCPRLNCFGPKKMASRAIRHSAAISESILGMKNRREDIRRLIYIVSDPGICRCSIAMYE